MIITVASFKGGVGTTTSAIHLAAFFQGKGKTLLIDADPNRSALGWVERGELPFAVVDQWQAEAQSDAYQHIIIDTNLDNHVCQLFPDTPQPGLPPPTQQHLLLIAPLLQNKNHWKKPVKRWSFQVKKTLKKFWVKLKT